MVPTHRVQVLCWKCFVQTFTLVCGWRCAGAERRQEQQARLLQKTHPAQEGDTNTAELRQDNRTREGRHIIYNGPRPPPARASPSRSEVQVCSVVLTSDSSFIKLWGCVLFAKVSHISSSKVKSRVVIASTSVQLDVWCSYFY